MSVCSLTPFQSRPGRDEPRNTRSMRLQEARALRIDMMSSAGARVGRRASQFSREYSRRFGAAAVTRLRKWRETARVIRTACLRG